MNRDFKVKDVQSWVGSYDLDSIHAIQQVLERFGANRKLERIVWSMIKEMEVTHVRGAENHAKTKAMYEKAIEAGKPFHPDPDSVPEPQNIKLVVGKCPKCNSNLLGEPIRGCAKQTNGNFGGLTFYKECSACTYYSEIFKKGNKHIEVEGG
jgi:hypothetical protein